jgi:catechol 2,3-dioxygenase-like lactoylglutathione lyase family enzyme
VSDVVDHVGIRVGDLNASRRLYEAALAELGLSVVGEGEFEGDAYVAVSYLPPEAEWDSGFALFSVPPEEVDDHESELVHLACLLDDDPKLGRALDLAREHGVAELDANGEWAVGDLGRRPGDLARRPFVLVTSVQSSGNQYAPYVKRHRRISTRKGVVWQPLGRGSGPFKLYASAYSRNGLSSKEGHNTSQDSLTQ